ncbi:hypothetical protein KIV56_11495 [Cryobacterium breve]|uniref:Treble clef zinc finger domain-containing protein n=1 Tax=Cryobacterium breve TaxID=1259258 RepID=A0ABY7NC10_9MICO|nr:zinc-ribbon domain-containing protein [Cryobacterium breve]WBM79115.1 hypothetical protein KIV56_11495 [Cryobacterium breve]
MESYSGRLLLANQETPQHRQHLTRLALLEAPEYSPEASWARVVCEKAALDPGHFDRARDFGLEHPDGSSCPTCTAGLGERWLCTNCSHGVLALQYPHLDNIICRHHSKWVGPGSEPGDQVRVGDETQVAESQFQRLRRRGVLDTHFYVTLRDAFRVVNDASTDSRPSTAPTDIRVFPLMMVLATALTRADFLVRLFDPRQSYATAYLLLDQLIRDSVGEGFNIVTRRLWLYLRPTFLTVRVHTLGRKPYLPAWAHDFPIPDSVIRNLPARLAAAEPFRAYLDVTGDYVLTAENRSAVLMHHLNAPKYPGTKRRAEDDFESICRSGHRITLTVSGYDKFMGPLTDGCRVCSNHLVEPGFNDLETRHPNVAKELHPQDNNGALPSEILPSSPEPYIWRCSRAGHVFQTSPYNRVHRDSGCQICINREFRPGYNDIRTLRPNLAKEWHPTLNKLRPEEVSVGSPESAWWQCRLGDEWEALIESRVHGHGCPTCAARKVHNGASLAAVRPDIAAEWDPDGNGLRTPDDIAANSSIAYWWRCPKNHSYEQRVDRRTAGSGCPYCARRKPLPGETDVASEYPFLISDWDAAKNAGIDLGRILPGTAKYWWKCSHGHEELQSIPHRVKSKGCIRCSPDLRHGTKPR